MFTRPPPPSETTPPPYVPGYIAFPSGRVPSPAAEEARLAHERANLHGAEAQHEQDALERAAAAQAAADHAWQAAEDARRARLAKLKEAALRAEREWGRMGGRVRWTASDARLWETLDPEAGLSEEERALRRAWEAYDAGWERLAAAVRPVKTFTFRKLAFSFAEVPWPVLRQHSHSTAHETGTGDTPAFGLDDITAPAIARFLLHEAREPSKSRREKLREAMLRYHPDKFEGRILPRIICEDRTRVQEGISIVMKCLNQLMCVEC